MISQHWVGLAKEPKGGGARFLRPLFKRRFFVPIFLLINVAGYLSYDGIYEDDGNLLMPVLFSSLFCFFALMEKVFEKKRDSLVAPEFIFTIIFSVFHFGYIWVYSLDLVEYDPEVFIVKNAVVPAIYFCTLSVIAFYVGYGMPVEVQKQAFMFDTRQYNYKKALFITKLLIILCILMFWMPFVILGLGRVMSDYRLLISVGSMPVFGRLFYLQQHLAIVALSMYCIINGVLYRKLIVGKFTYVVLFYIFGYLLIGDRGGFVSYVVIPLISYGLMQRTIPARVLAAGIASFLVVSAVIATTRTEVTFDVVSAISVYNQKAKMSPLLAGLVEYGGTLKTVVASIYIMPRYHDFWEGGSYVHALSVVAPNVLETSRNSVGSPGSWISNTVFASEADPHGRGGSIAMEAYLNFGFWGGIFTFVILGFFVKFLYKSACQRPNFVILVVYLSFMAALQLWVRNTSAYVFRPIVWSFVMAIMLRSWTRYKSCRGTGRTEDEARIF
jgi:oligosaccharide repeat unit polymerase